MFNYDRAELINIGSKCREIRLKNNLTMKQVAKLFNVGEYIISNFEYGRTNSAIIYNNYLKLDNGEYNIEVI